MDFKENMIVVGENIRTVREKKELSRKEVQDITGISQQYIGEIERGEGNPTLEVLYKLTSAYNVSIAELIGDPSLYNTKINSFIRKMKFTEKQDVIKLLSLFEKLDKEDIEIMMKLIQHFKK